MMNRNLTLATVAIFFAFFVFFNDHTKSKEPTFTPLIDKKNITLKSKILPVAKVHDSAKTPAKASTQLVKASTSLKNEPASSAAPSLTAEDLQKKQQELMETHLAELHRWEDFKNEVWEDLELPEILMQQVQNLRQSFYREYEDLLLNTALPLPDDENPSKLLEYMDLQIQRTHMFEEMFAEFNLQFEETVGQEVSSILKSYRQQYLIEYNEKDSSRPRPHWL